MLLQSEIGNKTTSQNHDLDFEALQRLDAFFSIPKAEAYNHLSDRFVDKYHHRFQADKAAFSRWLQFRLNKLRISLKCKNFSGLRVLDAGAGFGMNALTLALAGVKEVVAVDLLPGRIRDLTKLTEIAGLDSVVPICGDYTDVFQDYGPFDLIVGTCFLSHINDHQAFFQLCHDHLKTDGKLYVMDDNNALSPYRQISVRREWWASEFTGNKERNKGYFLLQRRKAADKCLPQLPVGIRWIVREWCAWATRGMTYSEVQAYCSWLLDRHQPRPPKPPCPYRDPKNGVPEERLLNPLRMARELRFQGFDVTLFPALQPSVNSSLRMRARWFRQALDSSFEIVAVRRN